MQSIVYINPKRVIGYRDTKIYGHFMEHFHRQIYDGIYDPASYLSDEKGIRKDVVQAIAHINPSIISVRMPVQDHRRK